MIKIKSGFATVDVTEMRHRLKKEVMFQGGGQIFMFGAIDPTIQSMREDEVSIEFSIKPQVVEVMPGPALPTFRDAITAAIYNSNCNNVSEAAKLLGVSRATLSRLLNGRSVLSESMAQRLQDKFDLNADLLLVWQLLSRPRS